MINEIMNIRKELGWTQARLAEHLGVNCRTVGRWELGQTKPSQLATEKIVRLQRDIMIGKITLNNAHTPRIQKKRWFSFLFRGV